MGSQDIQLLVVWSLSQGETFVGRRVIHCKDILQQLHSYLSLNIRISDCVEIRPIQRGIRIGSESGLYKCRVIKARVDISRKLTFLFWLYFSIVNKRKTPKVYSREDGASSLQRPPIFSWGLKGFANHGIFTCSRHAQHQGTGYSGVSLVAFPLRDLHL